MRRRIILTVRLLGLALLILLLVWTRGGTRLPSVYYMTGGSMEPTLSAGEAFTATAPVGHLERGMLVLFRYEDEDGVFHVLRRLAGLAGDTVSMRNGVAAVNGVPQPWPFLIRDSVATISPLARRRHLHTWGPTVVGRDSVFLLADLRDVYGWPDSRFLGPIPQNALVARAHRVVLARRIGEWLRRLD